MNFKVACVFLMSLFGLAYSWTLPWRTGVHQPHILGGESADIKDFPYQVSLRKKGEPYGHGHICGASILDELHVLTAAHCMARPNLPNMYYVVAASTTLDGGVKYNVERIFVHDQYSSGNPYKYDVAVIKLKDPLDFAGNPNIKPVPVVPAGEEPAPGSEVVVAGWGRTIPGNKKPELDYSDLMKLNLQIVERASCDACFGGTGKITEMLLCAGAEGSEKRDTSLGDSGGPLLDSATGMQVGVVSFGTDLVTLLCPGVYTNLATKEIREFIDNALAS